MNRQKTIRGALLGLTISASLAFAWHVQADDTPPQVIIKTFKYGPQNVTVAAGTTVTWINKDPEAHTVVDKNGKFRSSALDTDDTFTFTFTEPGTYNFFCSLHPQMTGMVTVTPKG
ncbi:MAG TPA: cupredoxin domain-containing protein [Magnetospirillaceae bacterium]|jgi:plastocyanin